MAQVRRRMAQVRWRMAQVRRQMAQVRRRMAQVRRSMHCRRQQPLAESKAMATAVLMMRAPLQASRPAQRLICSAVASAPAAALVAAARCL